MLSSAAMSSIQWALAPLDFSSLSLYSCSAVGFLLGALTSMNKDFPFLIA